MTDTPDKPTGRECVLLYLAHFIRTGGRPDNDPRENGLFGDKVYTLTPYRVENRIPNWSHRTYSKYQMGSTLRRRWRELKEETADRLDHMGITVVARDPGENESDAFNVVWDLVVDMDEFEAALQEQEPFTEYSF